MPDERPNIVLVVTEHHRWDALGIEDHPVLQTPYLDEIAAGGVHFRSAYTACPVCIPARRTLMTGRKAAAHGVTMNYNTRLEGPTLPGELSRAGYQTHLVGKLHLWPRRKLYGFDSAQWADAPREGEPLNDYCRWLRSQGAAMPRAPLAHGMNINGYPVRPWHLDERLHFTNWCADRAIDFLERRDPTTPFFLKVSFFHPHQPLTPPQCYYQRYMSMDLPEPWVAEWGRIYDEPQRGLPVAAWRAFLPPREMKQYRAAYWGSINHIDNQIYRFLRILPRDTIVVFTADHGEMLGDHQWIRKRSPFEGSAHIPMLMRFPESVDVPQPAAPAEPVELMDVMPTLLDAAGVEIPDTVQGRSLLPLLRGEGGWRDYLHGECAAVPTMDSGQQYLTDGRRKYCWFPGQGRERFFNLEDDPHEMHDLAEEGGCEDEIGQWRERLIGELEGRPEGFVKDGELQKLDGPTPAWMPGYEREEDDS